MAEFGPWVQHFEHNRRHHQRVDAAIDFDASLALRDDEAVNHLVASIQRYQLGESGDGAQLLAKAKRAGDVEYLCAAELFVAEEQQHAALLLNVLRYFGAEPMPRHWSDTVFVRIRRALGLRTELMVLTVAEVIALSYYGALAAGAPDAVVRAVAARIVDDEVAHVQFQEQRLRAGFLRSPLPLRLLAHALWWVILIGTTVVVSIDHGGALRVSGCRRTVFVRRVIADFAGVQGRVLIRPWQSPP